MIRRVLIIDNVALHKVKAGKTSGIKQGDGTPPPWGSWLGACGCAQQEAGRICRVTWGEHRASCGQLQTLQRSEINGNVPENVETIVSCPAD